MIKTKTEFIRNKDTGILEAYRDGKRVGVITAMGDFIGDVELMEKVERGEQSKIRIMFVCLGNICRSPMAEIIFKDIAEKAGKANDFFVSSSATSDENVYNGVGAEVYPPAKRILERHGLSADGKRAVQLSCDDYDKYDLFVCMDNSNFQNASRILNGDREGKLRLLMGYTSRPGSVSDPWYTGDFETAYADIEEGCKALFNIYKGCFKGENHA